MKAKLKKSAGISTYCVHGLAAVLTVERVVAGVAFVTHDYTREPFVIEEDHLEILSPDDAAVQALLYRAHLDRATAKSRGVVQ